MSYCLNPDCRRATSNPNGVKFCQSCGSKVLLLDRYRALQLIGQGGFGRTFLAVDENQPTTTTKPYCVIKQFFLQAQAISNRQKAAELFAQEAVRLETLGKHPQIPQFLAHFEQDNQQYLVQEFIDGQNLAQVLKAEGVFDEQQIRDLLNALLPVIAFIHSKNVIHRDIKPENILRRSNGDWVLVDFGAAKYATGTALARTGTAIGSAGYAAPEQAGGKATFSSDLYSLGVTCLHLLTQAEPFDLYSFSEANWVWRNYLSRPVSRRLGQVLDKMVEMATSRRFQSAVEALAALNSAIYARTKKSGVGSIPAKSTPRFLQPATPKILPVSNSVLQNWRCVGMLKGHTDAIRALSITPDGEMLASGSDDKTIKLWQLGTGEEFCTLRSHAQSVCSVAISTDGAILASGSEDKTIKLWQLETGLQIGSLTLGNWLSGDAGCVYAIAISSEAQILATLDKRGILKLWNLRTGQVINRLQGDTTWVQAIAISPNGKILAAASGDSIKLWNLKTGQQFRTLSGHNSWVRTVTFSPDAQMLASGSDDSTVKLWNLRTIEEPCTFIGHTQPVYTVAFRPIYKPVLSSRVSEAGHNLGNSPRSAEFEECAALVNPNQSSSPPVLKPLKENPQGRISQILASGSDDQTIKLWDITTGQENCTLTGHGSWIHAIAFSRDGQTLVSGGGDPIIYIWQCDRT